MFSKPNFCSVLFCKAKILLFKNFVLKNHLLYQPEVDSRTQGSRPRPRTQKKFRGQGQGHKKKFEAKAKAKDSLSEDRHSRGRRQECSRPRPRTKDTKRKCSPKKKGLHKNFSGDLHKKTFSKKFFNRSTKF